MVWSQRPLERPSTYQAGSAGAGQPDHSVAIVGWDDNWVTAGGTGAWLIRNSWGTGTQHFGMSYNDFYCGHDSPDTGGQNMGAVSFHNVVQNTYQEVYYHNDLGWTGQQPHAYAFNHFTADKTGGSSPSASTRPTTTSATQSRSTGSSRTACWDSWTRPRPARWPTRVFTRSICPA